MKLRLYQRGDENVLVIRDAPPVTDPTAGSTVAAVVLAAYGAAAPAPPRAWQQGTHERADWKACGEEHRQGHGHPVRYFPDGAECRICDVFWIQPVSEELLEARVRAKGVLEKFLGVSLADVDLVEARWTEGTFEERTLHAELSFEIHGRLPLKARVRLPASACWSRNGFVTTGTLYFTAEQLQRLALTSSSSALPSATPPPLAAPRHVLAGASSSPESPSED